MILLCGTMVFPTVLPMLPGEWPAQAIGACFKLAPPTGVIELPYNALGEEGIIMHGPKVSIVATTSMQHFGIQYANDGFRSRGPGVQHVLSTARKSG